MTCVTTLQTNNQILHTLFIHFKNIEKRTLLAFYVYFFKGDLLRACRPLHGGQGQRGQLRLHDRGGRRAPQDARLRAQLRGHVLLGRRQEGQLHLNLHFIQ